MDNPLVVLDSWEGIADYVPPEARMKVEQSLMAVLEDTGARMVLVSEHPETNSTLDQLAEAILVLHQRVIDDRRVRELEFRKLRGVPIRQERYLFTLAGGRLRYLSRSPSRCPSGRRCSGPWRTRRPTCPPGAATSMPFSAAACRGVRPSSWRSVETYRSKARSTCRSRPC